MGASSRAGYIGAAGATHIRRGPNPVCVNLKSLRRIVPHWAFNPVRLARGINGFLSSAKSAGSALPLGWCLYIDVDQQGSARIYTTPPTDRMRDTFVMLFKSPWGPVTEIQAPLAAILSPTHEGREYCLYSHGFADKFAYIGITKRPWHERFDEHRNAARRGSGLLFHRAIVEHSEKLITHQILAADLTFDEAMSYEEQAVQQASLYPLGLNMIPGGFAGYAYLARLGHAVKNERERDAAVADLLTRETVHGRPNPLCAARWVSDQDYINRVICGHSGRLTLEQVRDARLMASYGKEASEVAEAIGANIRQTRDVIASRRYGRVA